MNIKSYILGLGALSMVALTSCDTENVRSVYENSTAGITFLTAEQEEGFSEKATELLFNVDVVRQNREGEVSINLISTCMKKNGNKLEETSWNDDIIVPSSITFKDGETMTSFQVSLSDDIQQGVNHYVKVALDTKEAPVDANMSKLLTISRDFTYGELEEKNLSSTWFSNDEHNGTPVDKKIKIQQGTQNKNLYRTINVYKTDADDEKNYPMIIILSTDQDGKKVAEVAETKVNANLTVSGKGEWDDTKISLKMKFVDTKNEKEYLDVKEVFTR